MLRIKSSNPLKTDKTKINAVVPIATPTKETQDIICTKLLFFLVEKYLFAIKNGKFTFLIF
jgi:hypothetical protein